VSILLKFVIGSGGRQPAW